MEKTVKKEAKKKTKKKKKNCLMMSIMRILITAIAKNV